MSFRHQRRDLSKRTRTITGSLPPLPFPSSPPRYPSSVSWPTLFPQVSPRDFQSPPALLRTSLRLRGPIYIQCSARRNARSNVRRCDRTFFFRLLSGPAVEAREEIYVSWITGWPRLCQRRKCTMYREKEKQLISLKLWSFSCQFGFMLAKSLKSLLCLTIRIFCVSQSICDYKCTVK